MKKQNLHLKTTKRLILHQFIRGSGNIDFIGFTTAFHPRCGIYSISPDVISEFSDSDNSCNHMSRMNANLDFKEGFTCCFLFYTKLSILYE